MLPARTQLETGTTVNTGAIFAIVVLADTAFTTLTGLAGDSVAGTTFPAGMTLYGSFSTVTLASGKVILYYATA